MTENDWARFAAEVEATFRGDLAEDREAALKTHLMNVPFDAARGAVRWLVTHDMSWIPTPAEMVAALRRSAGEREARAWLAGYQTPEAYELAVVNSYRELAETTHRQMRALGRAE